MGALREQVTRQDDEVRQDEEVRQQRLRGARTRSEKSRSLAQAEGGRERAPANEKIENCPSQEGKLDLKEETHEKVREGEEGTNEGGPSVRQERIDDVSIPAEAAKKQPVDRVYDEHPSTYQQLVSSIGRISEVLAVELSCDVVRRCQYWRPVGALLVP
ncbi:hypothetical protein PC123_g21588 [Phytophthora cactorum]|nr:hypothetical protein PC123_g21588 [Phytophthora cactorum]